MFKKLILFLLFLSCLMNGQSQENKVVLRDTLINNKAPFLEKEPGRLINIKKIFSPAAVSSVTGETLYGTPVPNLSNTLNGRLAGLTVLQSSDEPGNDEASMAIRGVGSYGYGGFSTYKIFVDGFETNRNYFRYLSPAEIESVSILKDAGALATFGMRGANGILWVKTKRGRIGKPTVQVQARSGVQSAINMAKPLNSYEYANLFNQAVSNDNHNTWTPTYTPSDLEKYKNGSGVDVDWYNETLRKHGYLTDADVLFNGGDSSVKYNVVFNYVNQSGLYNIKNTDTTSNQRFSKYNIRTNLDFKLFKIFEARVDLGGRIENTKMPNYSIGSLWSNLARYPSNIYPVRDEASGGWSGNSVYRDNPVATITDLGWQSYKTRILQGNFELRERLDGILEGLYAAQAFSFNSYSLTGYSKTSNYARYINGVATTTDQTTAIKANALSTNGQEDWKQGYITVGYDREWGEHQLTSAVNYHRSNYRGDGFYALIYHYQNISGRANYVYKNRYIGDIGFSYFGTDFYDKDNRWGFYPAVSVGWILSNENFLAGAKPVDLLKLRMSAGSTASTDATQGSPQGQNGRYLYQQYYVSSTGFYTGDGAANGQTVLNPLYIANAGLVAEKSLKYNLGIDLGLWKKVNLTADVFMEKRNGIISADNTIPGTFGNNIYIANIGKQTNKGFEISGDYKNKAGKLTYSVFGMAAYNTNKIDYMGELTRAHSYNAQTGRSVGTPIGLEAVGYYQLSDFNADGSLKADLPKPAFGKVQPGDLKYRDIDGDKKVDNNDITAIGNSGFPKLFYSFGTSLQYAGFDLNVFFQGVSGADFNILNAGNQTIAFVNNGNAYNIARDAWAYYPDQGIDTRTTAKYPRLTTKANDNNYRLSSYWIKSMDFLRLKTVELGYSIDPSSLKRAGINKFRVFANALNPFTWSSLLDDYHIDPEFVNGYPGVKSFNLGISVTF